MVPDVGASNLSTTRTIVDFPAPFGLKGYDITFIQFKGNIVKDLFSPNETEILFKVSNGCI